MRLAALAQDPAAFGSTLAREQAFDDGVWQERAGAGRTFLAYLGPDVVGILTYLPVPDRPDERHLVGMWVAPSARRAGVGQALLDAVQAAAVRDGARRLSLDVADGNDAARRLYERRGFRATGEREPLGADRCAGQERFVLDLAGGPEGG